MAIATALATGSGLYVITAGPTRRTGTAKQKMNDCERHVGAPAYARVRTQSITNNSDYQ